MKLGINNVIVDWVKYVPRNFNAETTKHTIITNEGYHVPDVVRNVKIRNTTHNLNCIIKDTMLVKDKNIRYNELLGIASRKEVVRMSTKMMYFFNRETSELYGQYIITGIEENEIGSNFIDFNLTLEQVNFSYIKSTTTGVVADTNLEVKSKTKGTESVGLKQLESIDIEVPEYYKKKGEI